MSRYTCYLCAAKVPTAYQHPGGVVCESCFYQIGDIKSVNNVRDYFAMRHAGKSDYTARLALGTLERTI